MRKSCPRKSLEEPLLTPLQVNLVVPTVDNNSLPISARSSTLPYVQVHRKQKEKHEKIKFYLKANSFLSMIICFLTTMLYWNDVEFDENLKRPLILFSLIELIAIIFAGAVMLMLVGIKLLRGEAAFGNIGIFPIAREIGKGFFLFVFLLLISHNIKKAPRFVGIIAVYVVLTITSIILSELYWVFFVKDFQDSSVLLYEKNYFNIRPSQVQKVREEIKTTGLKI